MTDFFSSDRDRYFDVKLAHILSDMGQHHPMLGDIGRYWGDIGQYWEISGDIGVISSSVKSVMYLARPIQVVPSQLFF